MVRILPTQAPHQFAKMEVARVRVAWKIANYLLASSSCRGFAGCARRCIDRADKPINHLRVADGGTRRGPLRILRGHKSSRWLLRFCATRDRARGSKMIRFTLTQLNWSARLRLHYYCGAVFPTMLNNLRCVHVVVSELSRGLLRAGASRALCSTRRRARFARGMRQALLGVGRQPNPCAMHHRRIVCSVMPKNAAA